MSNNNKALTKKGITNNVWKFYLSAFFGSWSFATGILIFHYRELGFSFAQILGLAVVYEVLNFILEIPTGVLADLWSCKKTIMIGYFISGISFFIVLINPNTYNIYIIWSVLSAVCTTLNSGSVSAFTYDTMQEINPEKYPRVLSRISAISLTTQAITVIIGGLLSDRIGFNTALLISGIGGLLQALVFTMTIEPTKIKDTISVIVKEPIVQQFVEKIKSSFSVLFNKSEVRFLLFYGTLVFILSEFVRVIFQPYFSDMGYSTNSQIALFSAGSLIVMALSSLIVGKVKNRFNEGYLLLILSACLCLPLLLLKFTFLGVPVFIVFFFAVGGGGIVLSDIMNRLIPSESRATILSAQNQIGSISYSIVAVLIGLFIDQVGIKISALFIGLGSILIFLLLFSRKNIKAIFYEGSN